ncbi:MAG: class I SAM-dependent methyltransferase [Methanobacteriaceae archaeon]|jgi:ubiquinone/menaquinone biosynthesis C-methylase UbiE|nr:MAG: methyltransferase type 11 [Methanobacterium sp. BRmetb2]MCC7557458.1 class I SAM-dependent methyltransferase [Methanobacteriaceae archaeon]
MNSHHKWKHFNRKTPVSVPLDKLFYEKVSHDLNILDAGCGWGRIALQLQREGYNVTGFDINPKNIASANEFAQKFNSIYENKINFTVANALNLPYEDESFDVYLMQAFMTTIVDVDDRLSILMEAQRILKTGGILYIADFGQTWDPVYKKRYLSDYKVTGEMCTFIVRENGNPDGVEIYRAHHYSEKELKNLLRPLFRIDLIEKRVFTSYHGNKVNGFIVIASK